MKTILITGFEPFAGMPLNPALEAVRILNGTELQGLGVIRTVTVPVVHTKSIATVTSAICDYEPDAVLMVGLAPGRIGIMPERVAINVDDFRLVDNEGNQVVDEPVVEGGPAAYFTTLPIKTMVQEMRQAGIPASVSNSAGTFVCNHLFYGVMHELRNQDVRAGFIHVPLLPEQAVKCDEPSMALEQIVKGLTICARTVLTHQKDIVLPAGEIA